MLLAGCADIPSEPRAEITGSTTPAAEPAEPFDPSIVPLTLEQEKRFGSAKSGSAPPPQ